MTTKRDPDAVMAALAARVDAILAPDYLAPLLTAHVGRDLPPREHWRTDVLQLDGTGAATVEIRLDGRGSVFAKLFPDPADAEAVHAKLRALRDGGFGAGARYQAVEPLGVVAEHGMLLCRGVPGAALSECIGTDDEALLAGVREAATWLARLHAAPVRVGPPRSLLDSGELLPLARRMAKTTAARPQFMRLAVDMVREMEVLAERTREGLLVQTHGQYRPIHVFLGNGTVSVIDLDRSRPCDPARDVSEFVFRLRMMTWVATGSVERAEVPTRAFLDTYTDAVPERAFLANVPFHWARHALHSFVKQLKDVEGETLELHPKAAFCRSEFETAVAAGGA